MSLIVWQAVVDPGVQIVTLTQGLLRYPAEVLDEQSEPFTVMDITLMTGAVPLITVSMVTPATFPDAAVIVVAPVETEVASPLKPAVLLIVATDADVELHVTDPVTFCVVLSEKVPVAVNCCVVPRVILGLVGVTEMDTSTAGVTANVVEPDMLPEMAVIVVEPIATDVALPLESAALLMPATVVDNELQATDVVKFCVVLSE